MRKATEMWGTNDDYNDGDDDTYAEQSCTHTELRQSPASDEW